MIQPVKTKFKIPLSQTSAQRCQGRSNLLSLSKPLISKELSPLHIGRTQTVTPHTKKKILKRLATSIKNHTSAASLESGSPGISLPFDSQPASTAKYLTSTLQTDVHSQTDTNLVHVGENYERNLSKNVEFVSILSENLRKSETSFFGLDIDVMSQNSNEDSYAKKGKYRRISKEFNKTKSEKANLNYSSLENIKQKQLPSLGEKDRKKVMCTSKNRVDHNVCIPKMKPHKIAKVFKSKLATGKASDKSAKLAKLSGKHQKKHQAAVEHKSREKIRQDVVRTIKKMHMEIERLLTQRPGSRRSRGKQGQPRDQVENYLFTEE